MKRFVMIGSVLALASFACGRSEGPAAPVAADSTQSSAEIAPAADVAVAAPVSKASGKRIGLGFAVNMYGELEPCG